MRKIRLTENDLHNIIKESVKRVLNEIGDTNRGQYMLGKLSARNARMNGAGNTHSTHLYDNGVADYANKNYTDNPFDHSQPFNNGKTNYQNSATYGDDWNNGGMTLGDKDSSDFNTWKDYDNHGWGIRK